MNSRYDIIPKINDLPDYSNKRVEPLVWFGVNACHYTRNLIFGYKDVKLKGIENIEEIISNNKGGLIIPNHIESGDTIAIGTEFYKELGLTPYFVQNSSLPCQTFLRMLGGITFERGKDLRIKLREPYWRKQSKDVKEQEKIRHLIRQQASYDAVNQTIENSNLVTIYLQGGRKPNETTDITNIFYQRGLQNWLNCLGHQPRSIIPLNISHEYDLTDVSGLKLKKIVNLEISKPIMHTEGIEAITQHLIDNIEVFVSN